MAGRSLYGPPVRAVAGQKYGLKGSVRTYCAGEKIYPGDPVFGVAGDELACYGAHINAVTLTASEALAAGNEVAVTINGKALPVVEFTGSSAGTLEAVVKAIELDDDLSDLGITAFLIEGANAIGIAGPGITITAAAAVTGGAAQPNFTAAADTDMKFLGVAVHTELGFKEGTGFYPPAHAVNVMDFGEIYVPAAEDASPLDKEPAYIILSGSDAGKFTNDDDGNYDCGAFFRGHKEDGLVRIELHGMK
ncbi:MAG: hypothetical protein LBH73_01625 [Spirochaetaceae bacterium]|jgi:hypothetical protein|nr:hypothetical protein [Spirochaetaceae bacterium]